MAGPSGELRKPWLWLLTIDLTIAVACSLSWFAMVGVREPKAAAALAIGGTLVRVGVWVAWLRAQLRPLAIDGQPRTWTETQLRAAELAVAQLSSRFALGYGAAWIGYFVGIAVLGWWAFPSALSLGHSELGALGFQLVTAGIGGTLLAYPLAQRGLEGVAVDIATALDERELGIRRAPSSIARRNTWMAAGMVGAPLCWMAAMGWMALANAARAQTLIEARELAQWNARELALDHHATRDDAPWRVVDAPTQLAADVADGEVMQPDLIEQLDRRRERVQVTAAVGDGRWVEVEVAIDHDRRGFWLTILGFAVAIGVWIAVATIALNRSLLTPLASLAQALRRTLHAEAPLGVGRLFAPRHDELGVLFDAHAELLTQLEQLGVAAEAITRGQPVQVPDGDSRVVRAFVSMVAQLDQTRAHIHQTAVEVASAAAEIDASTAAQVLASRQQVDGVTETGASIQRLSQSTADISKLTTEQLSHAEQARERADEVAGTTAALQQSIERISATAAAVRRTLDEIASAHADSLTAAHGSREFAERSAANARHIHDLARVQAADSKLVKLSVGEISEIAAQSLDATSHTRAAATSLHEQAKSLERLLRIDTGTAAHADIIDGDG